MRHPITTLALPVLLAATLAGPASVLGADKTVDTDDGHHSSRHLIIAGGHDTITIDTEGGELTITMNEDGHTRVAVVDMEQVGAMVGDALGEAARALSDMQIQCRMGQDNSFSLALDDQEWEVDLDAIMAEVGEALGGALEGFDTTGFTSHHARVRVDREDEQELRKELETLREQLADLQEELARLQETARDR